MKGSGARKASKRRIKIRAIIKSAKAVPCADCEIQYPYWVMDFDHVRGTKRFAMGNVQCTITETQLLEEISKCDVVCSNCHRTREHAKRVAEE